MYVNCTTAFGGGWFTYMMCELLYRDTPALEDDCGLCFELFSHNGHIQTYTCSCARMDSLSYVLVNSTVIHVLLFVTKFRICVYTSYAIEK